MAKNVSAADLNLDLSQSDEKTLFKWFIASFLFGKRIQQDIAVETYRVIVEKHGRDTPRKLCNCTWQELVNMLGEGGYTRYDESTAERLLELCKKLHDDYGGKVGAIHEASDNRKDLEKRLQEFDGIGPKTVEIFMREAGPVWY
ncbi:MAG: DNA methylase [Halopseudomonas sp.]|uniref:DNA methylase n=1 Tax=Halopseudomonas sp. TaxID=2901191 RepID=UPI0030030E9D